MKRIPIVRNLIAVVLAALAALVLGSAHAEPKDPPAWSQYVVVMDSSVDLVQSDGDVYRASVWRGVYSGQTWYSIGRCLNESCSWIATALEVNETTGAVFELGEQLPGITFQITRYEGDVVGGQGAVDNIHFRLK